jgi:hypothetical protein
MNAKLRPIRSLTLAVALCLALPWAAALAQPPGEPIPGAPSITVVLDEFCDGWLAVGGQNYQRLQCDFIQDPISGIVVPTFFLPFPVAAGDVIVLEPAGNLSEVLRFPDIDGSGYTPLMMLFSDYDDGVDAPADVGLPDFFQHNLGRTVEAGDETFNFFFWMTPRALYFVLSDFGQQG